jgi:fructose-bisphosphate aldolase class I
MMPIVEPEVNIKSADRAQSDDLLLSAILEELDELLVRAKALGVFGTKERSVINAANAAGIAAAVAQQFQLARQVLAHGLMPIIEPEVNIKSADRADSDDLLLTAIREELDEVPDGQRVMLKLSIPAKAGVFQPLIDHPKVLRVVALSGGFSRDEACRELARNPGMIASFSRALLSDLRQDQDDSQFDATLGRAIDEIYSASVAAPAAA